MPPTQEHREIALSSPLGDDVLLPTEFSYAEQLGRPFRMSVRVTATDQNAKVEELINKPITIRLEMGPKKTRYFNGYVARVAQSGNVRESGDYQLTLVPALWFLSLRSNCRIFQEKKIPEIIKEVLTDAGIENVKDNLKRTYAKWTYCVQYRETDLNFVQRLMEQEGIGYHFKHENGRHTIVLVDGPPSHEANPEWAELPYWPQRDAVTEPAVVDWRLDSATQTAQVAVTDFDFVKPSKKLLKTHKVESDLVHEKTELFDFPGEYTEEADGEAEAETRAQEQLAGQRVFSGTTTCRGVMNGSKLKIKDPNSYLRDDLRREYLVIGVTINISAPVAGGGGKGGGAFTFGCGISAIEADRAFRPARVTPKPTIAGPQTAIVTGPKGDEIYTDEHGRVKVAFHWDRFTKKDDKSSCWIRVAQLWAGKGWGAMYIPRVGQEVIVEFLEGDPDEPIITGRVYNGECTPPYQLPDKKTVSTIKSNSSKGGGGFNEIRFEDLKDSEQLFVHAQKNMDVRVKNNRYETIGNDRHLVVDHDKFEHVKNERHETIDKSHFEQIKEHRNLAVDGNENKAVKKNVSLKVDGDVAEEFAKNQSTTVKEDLYIKAKNIVIEAETNITIKVGSNAIAIEKDGISVLCKEGGANLKSEATGNIESKATMDFKAEGTMNAKLKGGIELGLEGGAKAELKSPMSTVSGDGMCTIKGGVVMIN